MPTNDVIQPLLNPVKFVDLNPGTVPAYLSRHMDDYFYFETLQPWQEKKRYFQPWQNSDTISLQFLSRLDPMKISLIDIDERIYYSTNMTQGVADADDPTLYIYESATDLSSFDEGLYFLRIECGAPDSGGNYALTLISEPIDIAEIHKNSLLFEYYHRVSTGDIIFETGFRPTVRERATLRLKSLSSKDTFFEDQVLDMTLLQSKNFRVWRLSIGGATGIPDYRADLFNRIQGCSTLLIEGKAYTKSEGATMEDSSAPNYPLRSWSVDLREAENIYSKPYRPGLMLREDGSYMLREDGTYIILE